MKSEEGKEEVKEEKVVEEVVKEEQVAERPSRPKFVKRNRRVERDEETIRQDVEENDFEDVENESGVKEEAENEKRSSQEMVMGAYARKHSRYHRSVECETDWALQILWN